MNKKTCLACGHPINGRSDKKFCDDSCRNGYHNQRTSPATSCVRRVNGILGRNRTILEEVIRTLPGKRKMVRMERLLDAGFRASYFTHTKKDRRGRTCYYCYDHGLRVVEPDKAILFSDPDDDPGLPKTAVQNMKTEQ